eukprot:g5763.t1
MMASVRKAQAAHQRAGDARDFTTGLVTVATGKNMSVNEEELAEYVDEKYDDHAEAWEGTKELTRNTFKVGEHQGDCEVVGKVGEVVEDVFEIVHDTLRKGVTMGAGSIHGAVRDFHAVAGVSPQGMPAGQDGADIAEGADVVEGANVAEYVGMAKSGAEDVATSAAETVGNLSEIVPPEAVGESVQMAVGGLGEAVTGALVEEGTETLGEMFPVAGLVMPTYSVVDGIIKAGVGAGGLAIGGTAALLGGVIGGLAAPFDGGARWGSAMKVAGRTSAWSASLTGEGTLTAVKGTMGLVNQVPGCQIATVPIKIGCRIGAKSVRQLRLSGGETDSGVDDLEGAITENAVQAETKYQLVSADGKRVLQATSAKVRRGYQYWLGHGGYSLTFGDLQSAEAEEGSSSFWFSGAPGAYRLHSGLHSNNTLFFIGKTYPAQWVVWDVEGKCGDWEKLQLRWHEGGQKFKILGHGGQYVEWVPSKGTFEGGRTESEATEFALRERRRG